MSRSAARRLTKPKAVGIILGSFSVIGCSILVTLALRGELSLTAFGFAGAGGTGYRNVTLTDALLKCQEKARDQFGDRLKHITFDSHSSRYDQKSNRYKMFFNLELYPRRMGQNAKANATPHFLNCFVHGSRGSVTHFESVEDVQESTSPRRKPEGGLFGF